MLKTVAFTVFVGAATLVSAAAETPPYDPNRPVTGETVAAFLDFHESVLKLMALQTQIELGIPGDVAEQCVNRLLAHYSHPGNDTAWPFGMNWRDEKGWKNVAHLSEEIARREKFDDAHTRLCIEGAKAKQQLNEEIAK